MIENKVVRVALSGGLIGALATNPRTAVENKIQEYNRHGWRCHQVIPHSTRNVMVFLFQIIVLIVTLGLWTFGAGYLLLMERGSAD